MTSTTVARKALHKRAITIDIYEREDGLWDVEATLVDTKTYSFHVVDQLFAAGKPIHHMVLRITIDDNYTIVDASVQYEASPYPVCGAIASHYKQLIGLNLIKRFRYNVREIFAGKAGCTHVTELTNVLPTAAIQGISGPVRRAKPVTAAPTKRPHHLDGCHALRVDGDIVKEQYVEWYEPPSSSASSNSK